MRTDIKERWIAALKSGDYEQGRSQLHTKGELTGNERFCCLGVLCDLAYRDGVVSRRFNLEYHGSAAYGDADDADSWDTAELPYEVMIWAGLEDPNPSVIDEHGGHSTLAHLNDNSRKSFHDIAAVIEKQL